MTDNELLVKQELDKYFGENICVIFGILGNIKAESNCRGNNLQNSYEKKLGFTDIEYTEAIDHMDYVRDNFIYDHAGYGLCQWTYWSRKAALYDYWMTYYKDKSISDISMQVAFLNTEIGNVLRNKLMDASTVEEAARIFMLEFEKPANQSEENIEKRCQMARDLYIDWIANHKYNFEIEEDLNTSKKEFNYLQIVNSLESIKVYFDIMINAVKSLADEISHD